MNVLIIDGPFINENDEEVFGYRIAEITKTGASVFEETEAVFEDEQDVIDEITSRIESFEETLLSKEIDENSLEYDYYVDFIDDDKKPTIKGFKKFYREQISILRSSLFHVIKCRTL